MLTLDFTSCDRLVDGSYMGLHGVTISHIYISYIDIIYTYIDNIYIVKVYLLDFDSSRMPTVGIKISSIHPTIFSTFSCAFTNVYTACCCASDSPRLRDKTAGVPIPKARPFWAKHGEATPLLRESDYLTWNHEWILATSQEIVKFWQKIKLLSDQG